jgi:CelD/BcsL family acetyltransferase involved in cellulose biosynthesis
MNLEILSTRPAADSEWDQVWGACENATFFHSREWTEVWAAYTAGKMRPQPKMVEFNDRTSALIPICQERKYGGLLDVAISSPAGTYGGWISSDELSPEHARLLYDLMIKSYPDLAWRLNPYDRSLHQLAIPKSIPDETQTIDLEEGFDAAVQRWSKGHRKAVRQAQSLGVSIAQAATEDEWKQYYDVYAETLQRWGDSATSRYGWGLFKSLFGMKSEHIKLWTATHSGRMIAGCVIFYAKRHVAGWHASTLSDCFEFRPQHYLNYEILKDACDRGYRWYDLNPSGGHERVKEMKKHFGPTILPAPMISNVSTGMRIARKAERLMRTVRSIGASKATA